MRKLFIIVLTLLLVLVGCTAADLDGNSMNAPDFYSDEASEGWSSHTDSLEATISDPVPSDPTPTEPAVPDPSENSMESTEETESSESAGETDSAETQPPQQATETQTTPTTSPEESEPTPPATPETTPTQPAEPEMEETEQPKEIVDASVIAAEANAYAVSLGFAVDNSLNKSNSGYYCPDYRPISTNEIGIAAAKDLVSATKNQLNSRFSESYSPALVESIFGLVRVNCSVEYRHTDELGDWYYIYVFYG